MIDFKLQALQALSYYSEKFNIGTSQEKMRLKQSEFIDVVKALSSSFAEVSD